MISAILNHLWQSTLFAAAVALLAVALRKNRAAVRHALWLAASVKFLIPFSFLIAIGAQFTPPPASVAIATPLSITLDEISRPFPSEPARAPTQHSAVDWSQVLLFPLLSIWTAGFVVTISIWITRWRAISRLLRAASPLPLSALIPIKSTRDRLEPGVFGIRKPVLLLPEGIEQRLSPAQLRAILTHELAHVRRRDNLTAAIHMLVEAIFWFHPLVWWIETRLIDERERACDEEVLRLTGEPETYATGILEVCKLYLESPLLCVSGVTGADLRNRVAAIMTHTRAAHLNFSRKLLLTAATAAAIAAPLILGVFHTSVARAQTTAQTPAFDVASVKPFRGGKSGPPSARITPAGVEYSGYTLRMLIADAYRLGRTSIAAADARSADLLDRSIYEISAKTDREVSPDQLMLMLQALLAERFHLTLHRESKVEAVYKLVPSPGGPKLHAAAGNSAPGCSLAPEGGAACQNTSMFAFSNYLSERMGRPVLDATGLQGSYDFVLKLDGAPGSNALRQAIASSDDPGSVKRSMAASLRDWTSTSIFSDLPKQLGLKLESDKGPIDHLVIDRLEKLAEN